MPYVLNHGVRTILTISPVVIIACCLARILIREADGPKRLSAGLLIAFTVVIATSALLGVPGALSFSGYVGVLWPLAAAAFLAYRRYGSKNARPSGRPDEDGKRSWPITVLAILSTTVTVGALATKLLFGIPEYDELTYHLFFPNQWITQHHVFLIDTPFGDASPGYAPANGELWYVWLMAPMVGPAPGEDAVVPPEYWVGTVTGSHVLTHGGIGLIAKIGQFPFLLLLGASLAMLARRLGANGPMKFLPALLLPFIPWVLHQASSALVDLIMAALLIAALAFGHEYRSSRRRLDAAAAGLSLGLACGVKFVTLAYLPLVILPVLSAFIARRDGRAFLAFSLTGLLAGAPWYVRNAWLTGNPLFPMDVSLFGHAILRGAYTRQSLMASALHVRGGWAVVAVATHAVGLWFSVVCIAGIVAGLFYCRRRAEWRSLAWIAPVGLAWHFLVVPYSSQDRFLIWIAALSLLPLALWPDTGKGRLWLGFFLAALVGTSLAYPRIYWQWGSIQASTNPLVSTDAVALRQMALVALIVALARYALLAKTWRGTVVATVAVGIASTFVRPVMFVRPMNANIPMVLPIAGYIRLLREHPNAVAYSGHNAPYLLAGASGRTRVVYVNIDGLRNKHLYDYVRDAAAAGQRAAANGEPDRDRRNPSFQAWRAAMVDLGIQYLFVEPMSPSGAADIGRDSDGFPVERAWARGHPEAFRPVASDRKWEIYAVLPPGN